MTLEYEVTLEDYMAFSRWIARGNPDARRQLRRAFRPLFVTAIMGAATGGLLLYLNTALGLSSLTALAYAILSLSGLLGYIALHGMWSMTRAARHGACINANSRDLMMKVPGVADALGWQRVMIGPSQLVEEREHQTHTYDWLPSMTVGDTKDHIFVGVSPIVGIIIPKRACAEPAQVLASVREAIGLAEAEPAA